MLTELRELYRYRDLLAQLIARDLKVRYKNSVLGFFWSLLNPLLQVATMAVAFRFIMKVNIPNYSAYLLVAFLPWTFFQMSLMDASQSVLAHHDLLKKVYFPREVLPISMVIANLIHFLLALLVFFVYLLVLGTPIIATWLLMPVLVVIEFMLVLGLSFFVSALNVFYEDVKYIVGVILNVLFYLTPVIYMSELVYTQLHAKGMDAYYSVYQLNPLNALVIAFRKLLLIPYSVPPGMDSVVKQPDMPLQFRFVLIAAAISLTVLVAGYAYFNARKWRFAESM
jgi:ABC-type polysaccharide/polyol phosphate export permease